MSDLLSIGASGVRAYQTALTTVSENISNAGTAGYTRRTTALREVSATGGLTGISPNGMGVVVGGIVRNGDDLRAAEVRTAGSDLARTESSAVWMGRIETALTDNKLGDRLTAFFNAAQTVAADPAATAPRAAMLETAATLAGSFRATGTALDAAAADLDATADLAVTNLNSLSANLAQVNSGLSRAPEGTSGRAALLDQRDQLLESMSALTDVSVSLDSLGRATVRGGDAGGPILVSGDQASQVTYVRNDEGAVSLAVHRDSGTSVLSPNGGALAGIIEGAQRITAARAELNGIATAFVEGINDFQAGGEDLQGAAGAAMFAAGTTPTDIGLSLSDPRGIAAASVGGGVRDNGNLTALAALRTSAKFEGGVTDLVTGNATALAGRKSVALAQSAIRDGAISAREAASGVNLDEEAVDLIRFQQAYQASSRVIQVARETLQSILDIR
jgi:flagellar hook-associated protein 1 FlgK